MNGIYSIYDNAGRVVDAGSGSRDMAEHDCQDDCSLLWNEKLNDVTEYVVNGGRAARPVLDIEDSYIIAVDEELVIALPVAGVFLQDWVELGTTDLFEWSSTQPCIVTISVEAFPYQRKEFRIEVQA